MINKFLNSLPNWILITSILGIIIFLIIKLKELIKFLNKALFGSNGADYKELAGASGFLGFISMLIKHLLVETYNPNESLLNACITIVLVMAGIGKGSEVIKTYLSKKDDKQESITNI